VPTTASAVHGSLPPTPSASARRGPAEPGLAPTALAAPTCWAHLPALQRRGAPVSAAAGAASRHPDMACCLRGSLAREGAEEGGGRRARWRKGERELEGERKEGRRAGGLIG